MKVYATSWQGLVMIEDIYEQRYLVNCDDPEALRRAIEGALNPPPKKIPPKSRSRSAKNRAEKDQASLF